ETPSAPWWSNPFVDATDGLSFGEALAGGIHIVNAPVAVGFWTVDQPGAALVCAPGTRITDGGVGKGVAAPVSLRADFAWFECTGVVMLDQSVQVFGADFVTVHKTAFRGQDG